jgi:hypothetical protein
VDRDGLLDLYIPDMAYGCLLLNKGQWFIDMTAPSNLAITCGQYTGWGGLLFDYDNDGYLDVFVANGNAHHEYTEEDVLMRNSGPGKPVKFVDVADQSGSYFREKYVGRGAACADYDNDGDIDVLVMNLNGPTRLLRNDSANTNHRLTIAPKLARTKVPALGARVTVTVGEMRMIHEVGGVTGYLSQSDPRAHFGLAQATKADRVEILWPNGRTTKLENVEANQILDIVQNTE